MTRIKDFQVNSLNRIQGLTRKYLLIFAGVFIFGYSCSKDNENDVTGDPTVTFFGSLNGINEIPPTSSTATGSATLKYDTIAKVFTLEVNYRGIVASRADVNKGDPHAVGVRIFDIPAPLSLPIQYSSPVLTAEQQADLFSNLFFVKIRSTSFPDGEIRGNLIKQRK